jgi:hypothetical protein
MNTFTPSKEQYAITPIFPLTSLGRQSWDHRLLGPNIAWNALQWEVALHSKE